MKRQRSVRMKNFRSEDRTFMKKNCGLTKRTCKNKQWLDEEDPLDGELQQPREAEKEAESLGNNVIDRPLPAEAPIGLRMKSPIKKQISSNLQFSTLRTIKIQQQKNANWTFILQ